MADYDNQNYGKRPLWQWILIYAIIGAVVYGLIYYFVLSKKGTNDTSPVISPVSTSLETSSPQATVSASVQQGQNTTTLSTNSFSPAILTIKAGETVTWVNDSGADATVNSFPHPTHTDYPPLNLGVFANGEFLTLTFNQPGTYKYHNHFKASQAGTIVVQ